MFMSPQRAAPDTLEEWWSQDEEGQVRTQAFSLSTNSGDDLSSHLAPTFISNGSRRSSLDSSSDDLARCNVCAAALGKRRLNPRHHCRVCDSLVCGACSPSMVKLEGFHVLQRVCTPCLASAHRSHRSVGRFVAKLVGLGEELHAIAGGVVDVATVEHADLDQALSFCEAALGPLRRSSSHACEVDYRSASSNPSFATCRAVSFQQDSAQSAKEILAVAAEHPKDDVQLAEEKLAVEVDFNSVAARSAKEKLAAEVDFYRDVAQSAEEKLAVEVEARHQVECQLQLLMNSSLHLGRRLHSLVNTDVSVTLPTSHSAQEFVDFCESAFVPLRNICEEPSVAKAKLERMEAELAEERHKNDRLSLKLHELEHETRKRQACWISAAREKTCWQLIAKTMHIPESDSLSRSLRRVASFVFYSLILWYIGRRRLLSSWRSRALSLTIVCRSLVASSQA